MSRTTSAADTSDPPKKAGLKTVARIFAYLRRYPGMASATLACAVMSTLMVVVFPAVTQIIVDDVIKKGDIHRLWPMVAIGTCAFLLQHGFNALRIILNNTFEQRVIFDLRSDLYSHLQTLPLAWFDNRATGDIMTRVLEDVTSMERMLIDGIEQGVVAILQIAIVLVVMAATMPVLAAWALAPVPFLIAGALLYTLTAHKRYRLQRKASSAMNALLHDNLAGIRQIKTYVRETEEHRRFDKTSGDLKEATLVVMRAWACYHPTMEFLAACGLVLVTGFGGQAVIEGKMGLGDLVKFLMLTGFLYEPIGRLHSLNQLIQSGRAAGERVFEIMDEPGEPGGRPADLVQAPPPTRIRGDVRYADVSFAYPGSRAVLKHISLHARPGETVALVGPTGAGKSTLVNLLTRFYEYDDGEILVDGVPLREIPKPELRRAIGMVTQESFLFNGTVRDNLRLGKPGATDAEMFAALDAANARGFIENLPEKLDTSVGERGVKLSVGEKQRVSIARALLKDPPILILDEATASVDTATERLIQEALDRLMAGRTSFVIAHRLSTVRHAAQILVLEAGRIVERGTHADLAESAGLYAKLCRSDFISPPPAH